MPKPITIGQHDFRTQKAALKYIAALRDRYIDGEAITGDDAAFLGALLPLHPEATQKIGLGIAGFTVATEQVFNRTRHFVVRRNDGSETDFSFHSCVKGADERRDRLQALRVAIAPQAEAFKADTFRGRTHVLCAARGVPTSFAGSDVDHTPPRTFAHLVECWLAKKGLTLDDVEISDAEDNQIVSTMSSDEQQESWRAFHQKHARLRVICREANLSEVRTSSRSGYT